MAKVTITNLDTLVNTAVSTNVNVQAANDAVVLATSKASEASGYADTAGLYADVTTADKIMVAELLSETEVARDDAEVYKIAANDYMLKALQYRDESNIERDLAEAALEEFKNKWLGAFPIGPVSDPDMDGQPIEIGALYWNTNVNATYVYTGSNWRQAIPMAGALYADNNLVDLEDIEVARDNLGVYSTDEVDTIAGTKYDKAGGTISGDVTVNGTLTVNGTTTTVNSTTVTTADNTIVLNNGEVGAGVTAGTAGIEIDRGTETNYKFVFSESDDSFKIGVDGELQKVATREDTPIDTGVARWDASTSKLITETTLAGLTLDDVSNKVGADHIHYKVKNQTGVTIPKGTVISFTGIVEDEVVRVKPYNSGEVAIGITHADILHGDEGLVINAGRYDGYATNMYTTFTVLYPADGGGLTDVKPTSGHYQMCATVIKSGPGGSGVLLVEFTAPTYIGSTTQSGYVQLNDTLTSTSTTEALTANQGKALQDGKQPKDTTLTALADVMTAADKLIYATGVDTFSTTTVTSAARALLDDVDTATMRTTLGVTIGTNVQAYDAGLQSIAELTTTADKMVYTTASDVYATTTLTTFGRSLLDDVDAEAARTTLEISASNTPNIPAGSIAATNIQAAINELDTEKSSVSHDHDGVYEPADATILKDADIGVTVQGYDVNTVVDTTYVHTDNNYTTTEKNKLAGVESGATADQIASEVPVTAQGNLSSTTVQLALEELQGDLDSILVDTEW